MDVSGTDQSPKKLQHPNWTFQTTEIFHNIIIPESLQENSNLEIGDCIGLFYSDEIRNHSSEHLKQDSNCKKKRNEKCAGFLKWNGIYNSIMVFGDSPNTPNKDGYVKNEMFKFKIWKNHSCMEFDLEVEYCEPFKSYLTDNQADSFLEHGFSKICSFQCLK